MTTFLLYEKEAHFRRVLHYPPYTALANVLVRDRKVENAIRWSRALAGYFAPFDNRGLKILGPAAAPLARLAQRVPFSVRAESCEAVGARASTCGMPGFLRIEENSRYRRDCGRRPDEPVVNCFCARRNREALHCADAQNQDVLSLKARRWSLGKAAT